MSKNTKNKKTPQKTSNQTKKRSVKKVFLIFAIILLAIVTLLALTLLCVHLFTPAVYNDFFSGADTEYVTPGLSDGFIPQGYTYVDEAGIYLHCGYMNNSEKASRIYIVDAKGSSDSYYIELHSSDGMPYTGHTGGIASARDYVWIANDGDGDDNCVWVLSLNELLSCEKGGRITLKNKFKPETHAAFCYADDEYLWVGEFHNEKYPTSENHRFEVSGGVNSALICAYPLDDSSYLGISESMIYDDDSEEYVSTIIPDLCLSVTDRVQGFTVTDRGFIALSISYGMSSSHLLIYSPVADTEPDANIVINENEIPVYFLDEDLLIKDVEMPPMSEEIISKDGKIFVSFESASQKYIFGNFTKGRHIYSYDPE